MELKNNNTQEIATVQRLHVNNDGQIVYKDYNVVGRAPSARFFANNPMLADTMTKDGDGWPVLRLSPAWEIVKGSSRRTDGTKPEKPEKPENAAQYKYNIGDLVLDGMGHDTEQHTVTDRRLNCHGKPEYLVTGLSGWFGEYCLLPAKKTEATQNTETQAKKDIKTQQTEKQMEHDNNMQKKSDNLSDAEKLLQIISNLKGGGNTEINAEQVKKIVLNTISQLSEKQQKTAIKAAKSATGKVAGRCKDYENILQDVADGFAVYLHGPAGCGKSYTAEQIAADLDLSLYSATTLQFAHDVKGYGDAAGKYVATAFYHAFVEGGLYFLDEADPEFMFQDFNGFPQQFYKESMNAKDFDNVLQWYAEEVKELSKPTKKIENKGFEDMKPEFLETIESKSWRAFRKKEFFAVLKLPEGWLPIDKSTIETTFWVSEGSDRPMKEALKICDYYRTKEGFIESNLPDAEKLEKQKKLKAFIYISSESDKLYSVRFDVDKEEADRHVYGGTLRELTPEEKAAYIAAHDAETENFKKRLETWWKRYGADHVHAHTYWADR